jgi:hypothetical protein
MLRRRGRGDYALLPSPPFFPFSLTLQIPFIAI